MAHWDIQDSSFFQTGQYRAQEKWGKMVSVCAVPRRRSSVGATPTRQLSFQPVAIGTAVAATILPKLLRQRAAAGGPASQQAVTRVNAEQASKGFMWEPTRH
jgi:hypothetical protein